MNIDKGIQSRYNNIIEGQGMNFRRTNQERQNERDRCTVRISEITLFWIYSIRNNVNLNFLGNSGQLPNFFGQPLGNCPGATRKDQYAHLLTLYVTEQEKDGTRAWKTSTPEQVPSISIEISASFFCWWQHRLWVARVVAALARYNFRGNDRLIPQWRPCRII